MKRTKGAGKLHLLLDHSGSLPSFAVITESKDSEREAARRLNFEAVTIAVFDRSYMTTTGLKAQPSSVSAS